MNRPKPYLLLITFLIFVLPSFAGTRFILRTQSSSAAEAVAARYGLTLVGQLEARGAKVVLVEAPDSLLAFDVVGKFLYDSEIVDFERETVAELPERTATVSQSTAGILDGAAPPVLADYFGTPVLSTYVYQPATALIRLYEARQEFGVTGAGVVAVIDTGVDPEHPVLKSSLLPGFDFVNNISGTASEYADVSPELTASLTQSTAGILDKTQFKLINSSTMAILDQSTAGILDSTQVPAGFGHGTMVAGIIHLTAPTAKIMPLKAFRSSGTAALFDILRAVYYAANNNVNVINMSFSLSEPSPELRRAIRYATDRGIVCIAASGNGGQPKIDYPATLPIVVGIGSTTNQDVRSTFSNYGPGLFLAAPGEGVITTYPGQNFAAAWGTSFSTPFVVGTVALLVQRNPQLDLTAAQDALSDAQKLDSSLGYGRLDVYRSLQ